MSDTPRRHIEALLDAVERRRRRYGSWRLAGRLAAGLAVTWLTAGATSWLLRGESPLVDGVLVVLAAVLSLGWAAWLWRRRAPLPTRAQLARLVEDRVGGLDDRLVTAVQVLSASSGPDDGPVNGSVSSLLLADTARRLSPDDIDLVVSPLAVRQVRFRALAGTVLALAGLALAWQPMARTVRMAWLYAAPHALRIDVRPGNARVAPGVPLTIQARPSASAGDLVPELRVRVQDASRTVAMRPDGKGGFAVAFDSVPASFTYHVRLAGRTTREYAITLLQRPRVSRIDLDYAFPEFTRLAPKSEKDGGDIYAPAGTRVRVTVVPRTVTAPVTSAALMVRDGREIALERKGDVFEGDFPVDADTAYRVRLRDADGLDNADDPEYFVRLLDDLPPDVRVLRPAGDRQVTPLEEVTIEARADDDHGVQALELVVLSDVRGGNKRVIPLGGDGTSLSATGRHTVFLEELHVKPGDVVGYYARARDIARGKHSTEARSDIFFLEVTSFTDEFALAQSQAMAGGQGGSDDLIRLQKEIISGTWKLQRRADVARSRPSAEDARTLAKGQAAVRRRAELLGRQLQAFAAGRRQRSGADAETDGESPLVSAARAMARAESALNKVQPADAMPHEMEALTFLSRAQSEEQRKEITRQQAGGSGGFNRAQQDLSSLFDRELQRQQQTNYETPNSAEDRRGATQDQALEKVRELARRQEALAHQQADLARDQEKLNAEEVRRRLERLTREQSDLRRQAETLAQQLQQQSARQQPSGSQQGSSQKSSEQGTPGEQSGQQQPGGQRSASAQTPQQGRGSAESAGAASALREASEDMRGAASELRREAPDAARERSARALQRLQDVESSMRQAGPDEQRRAVGDVQLEARQLADRQRELAAEAGRTPQGASGEDARRRLAGEQQRLGDRADQLTSKARTLSSRPGAGDRAGQQRIADAVRELESARVGARMRELAEGMRRGDPSAASGGTQREMARALDRMADRMGQTSGARDQEGQQVADALSRTRELREKLGDLQKQIEAVSKQAGEQGSPGKGTASPSSARGRESQQPPLEAQRQLADLRRQYLDALRQAGTQGGDQAQGAGMANAATTPVGQQMVTSAPGTEAFKQDFSKWESLHKEVRLGLEQLEASLSQRLVESAARDRLRSGAADRAPAAYRGSIDRYFRSLAQEPR